LDSRIMTAWYQGGTLFGALDTAARFTSPGSTEEKAGIEWFVVHAAVSRGRLHTALRNQGVLAVADNNVSFPDIAVNRLGQGVMGMSLMGDDYYPSAAWTTFGRSGPGTVHVVAKGRGPYDGFGAYPPIFGRIDGEITRWGDYGAATAAGGSLWVANEWVGQTCTLQEYVDSGFTCGDTRSPFENWYTRITAVTPRS